MKYDTSKLTNYYNGCIKTFITVFGMRFSNVIVNRKGKGKSKKIIVPIEYGNRQNYLRILDASQSGSIDASFPRIVFELTGFSPNMQKADNESNIIKCVTEDGEVVYTNSPIWWNVDVSMYITTKNVDDGLQIIEQIVPDFRPNEVWKIKFLDKLPIIDNVYVTLNSGSLTDNWEGGMDDRRYVVWNLSFTTTIPVYGRIFDSVEDDIPVIWDSNIHLNDDITIRSLYDDLTKEISDTVTIKGETYE